MAGFAAVVEIATLNSDGSEGFTISGEAAGDFFGFSVAAAGDVNGDGIDDFVIGAKANDALSGNGGASYVVFGTAAGFPISFDLSTLNGANGFQVNGDISLSNSGWSVASAGDVNGDGVGDLIIGAPYGSFEPGSAYIVFGKDTAVDGAFAANLSVAALDGTNGFKITGQVAVDLFGASVASAGDINGDGIDDLIVGAWAADPNGTSTGSAYVVFGRDTAASGDFLADLDLTTLDGTNGFKLNGALTAGLAGYSVASAGDVNGDGIDDLIIGARDSDFGTGENGVSFVVFGKDTATDGAFGATLNLSGANCFVIAGAAGGDHSGWSVASAGDVNGDGIDDLIIGAPFADVNGVNSGAAYVVFGKDTAADGNLAGNLNGLNGINGFRISGEAAGDYAGISVASAGDVNGDGVGDLIIGARNADGSGASYVVFGKDTAIDGAFPASLDLSGLDGAGGFKIAGVAASDFTGASVASAGDINDDGYDDLIVGASRTDQLGSQTGSAYVIFGHSGLVSFIGTGADETEGGGGGGDSLSGMGGKDVLSGLGGADFIDGGDANDVLYGGTGADDLVGGAGNDWLQGDDGDDDLNAGDGADKLFGGLGADDLVGGLGNDRFDGGDGIDVLTGGVGNDYLDGGTGADVMTGGTENDVYLVDDAADQTIEALGEGYDIVRTALDGWVLGSNIEGLELQGVGDIDGSGNGLANNLQGNAGANTLSGEAGADTINGNDGDDHIVGGLGNDLLRGGTGADAFVVAHAFGATLETDQVYDFSTAEGDFIDLSGIDAVAGGADDAFVLVGAFSKVAGQMTLSLSGGTTLLKLDVTGDGKPDYQMKISGDVTGDWGGWML